VKQECFLQEKYEEGLAKKLESDEDTREYHTHKIRLWIQAYAPNKKSLVEFKDEMLMGLCNAELKETCLFFMPKEAKRKGKIKSVLDRKLSPDRHEFKTTYLNSDRKLQERG